MFAESSWRVDGIGFSDIFSKLICQPSKVCPAHPCSLSWCQPASVTWLALWVPPAVNWGGVVSVSPMWLATAAIPVRLWHLDLDLRAVNVRTPWTQIPLTLTENPHILILFSLGCECDPRGSISECCDQVEGQCVCHPEVVGRRCDHCKAGFWGFPDCRPCECGGHSETCHGETGACVNCREHTTGVRCERSSFNLYCIYFWQKIKILGFQRVVCNLSRKLNSGKTRNIVTPKCMLEKQNKFWLVFWLLWGAKIMWCDAADFFF